MYRVRGFEISGRGVVNASIALRVSSGSAWYFPASTHHIANELLEPFGLLAARSWHSLGSRSVL